MTEHQPCPKCNGKKITIISVPMMLNPEKSMHQAQCAKKSCGWKMSWAMSEESAMHSWDWFNDGKQTKKTKKG